MAAPQGIPDTKTTESVNKCQARRLEFETSFPTSAARTKWTTIPRDIHVLFVGIVFDNDAIACRRNDCASNASVRLEFCPF
jgi:hypothetical protein